MNTVDAKKDMRKMLRAKRRALSIKDQTQASLQLVNVLKPLLKPKKIKRIAVYTARDGEIDLAPLITYCQHLGIDVYLPIVHRFKPTLWFARFQPNSDLFDNRFGIPEPLNGTPVRPWQLDLVFLPLVGFDVHGGRLGMGGGFYDRTFAHTKNWPKQPRLFGVAHECQKVAAVPRESWDIVLNGVITDQATYFSGEQS